MCSILFIFCFFDFISLLKFWTYLLQAWFRRAKANASLGNYKDAINDLSVSMKIETSSDGKRQIESELNLLLDQSRLRSCAIGKSNGRSTGFLGTTTTFSSISLHTLLCMRSSFYFGLPYIIYDCRQCSFCGNQWKWCFRSILVTKYVMVFMHCYNFVDYLFRDR